LLDIWQNSKRRVMLKVSSGASAEYGFQLCWTGGC
jgi:hypothetical protein